MDKELENMSVEEMLQELVKGQRQLYELVNGILANPMIANNPLVQMHLPKGMI